MKAPVLTGFAVVAIMVLLLGWAPVSGAPGDVLVIVGFGGSYQQAQDKALFQPFQQNTGTKIIQDTGMSLPRVKTEVLSGHPSFDLGSINVADFELGLADNLYAPIDYQFFDTADLRAIPAEARLKYGVGTVYYAQGIAYSTKAFGAGSRQPASWKDFWDVAQFPGKRVLPACARADFPTAEAALLADGVPVDKLYPVDIPRAAQKLKQLAPNVIWYTDAAQAGQLLVNQEGVMALGGNGRFQVLIDQGAPLKFIWNQARYTFDVWFALHGARHLEPAMRFVAFASRPAPQARLAQLSEYGPVNPRAFRMMDRSFDKTKLATYPPNVRAMFRAGDQWWRQHRQEWIDACRGAVQ